MTGTVLVLPAGQLATVIIKSLRKDPSLRIIAGDTNFLAPGLHLADKGYLIPSVADIEFYDKIHDIIKKESVDVIFPCSHFFAPILANHARQFSKMGAKVLVSQPKTLDKCLDKWKTYEYFSEIVPMPKSTIKHQVEYIVDFIGFPAIIKPRVGSGSKNVHKLEDMDDLNYYIKKVPNPIMQEFIEGEHYAIDMLVNEDGKFLYAATKNTLEMSDGIPIKAVIKPRKDIILLAKELCTTLKFFGALSVNTILDEKDSKLKLIEINPRTGISVILSVAAGYNVPLDAVYLALGQPINPPKITSHALYMSRYYEEIFQERSCLQ